MVEAIKRGDGEGARRAMLDNMEELRRHVVADARAVVEAAARLGLRGGDVDAGGAA